MRTLTSLFVISLIILIVSIIFNITKPASYEYFNITKPITIIQYSGFLCFALFLNLFKGYIIKLDNFRMELLIIFVFLLLVGTLFEMLWSFMYWFSTYELKVINGSEENAQILDTITYNPSLREYYFYENRILNHSAKRNTMWFGMSLYLVYFLLNIKLERRLR